MRLNEFVVGDTKKPLRYTVLDDDGNVVDVSLGETRLFATGIDNNDRPASNPIDVAAGVLGVLVTDGSDGVVDFEAMGALVDIGTVRSAQVYKYRVRFEAEDGKFLFGPEQMFVGRRSPVIP